MSKIKYVISSHKSYYNVTVKRLVNSLNKSGIPNEDIFIVVGGEGNDYFLEQDGIEHKNVFSNSFDLTGFIECVKYALFPEYDYFFLLHDTCEVGENFRRLVEERITPEIVTLAMCGTYPSSNIGLYKRDHVMNNKQKLVSLENQTKDVYVNQEDLLLVDKYHNCFDKRYINRGVKYVYSDNVQREVIECIPIQLYKYKANWYVRDWVIKP
jgi:hypothetical protein